MTRQAIKQNLRTVLSTARHLLFRPGFDCRKGFLIAVMRKHDTDEHDKNQFI